MRERTVTQLTTHQQLLNSEITTAFTVGMLCIILWYLMSVHVFLTLSSHKDHSHLHS